MLTSIITFLKDVFKTIMGWVRSVLVFIVAVIIIFVLISVLASIFIPGSQSVTGNKETVVRNTGGRDKIVLIPLSGLVANETSVDLFSSTNEIISPKKVETVLQQAQTDPLVKAVIFDLNSPGGSPVAADRIYELITDFKQETKIPVIFLFGDLAASGGYYIASTADHIVANPATLNGSIGVIMETYNLEGLYDKLGIAKYTFKKGDYKDILNEARAINDEEKKLLDTLNQDVYDLFLERVATGRQMELEEVKNLANGKIYSGKQAKGNGLVDSLGNLNEAISQAKKLAKLDKYQVVEYESTSFFKEFFSAASTALAPKISMKDLLEIQSNPIIRN